MPASQVEQSYFKHLSFIPAAILCLALEEVIAEKIRAASQRSKIRDLYDLSELARRPLQKEMIRSLAVLKLWNSGARDWISRVSESASRREVTTICLS